MTALQRVLRTEKKNTLQIPRVLRILVPILVLFFWIYVLFSMLSVFQATQKAYDKRHAVIPRNVRLKQAYQYYVTDLQDQELTLLLDLEGPFIPALQQSREYNEEMMNTTAKAYAFVCVLERWIYHKKYDPKENRRNLTRPREQADVETAPAGLAKIMMINKTATSTHILPLDYNNYPRSARLVIPRTRFAASNRPESAEKEWGENFVSSTPRPPGGSGHKAMYYAIGFGVDEAQTKDVPFSLSYKVDPIAMRDRVLVGLLPLMVLSALLLLGINRGVSAIIAIATAAAGFAKTGDNATNLHLVRWWDTDLIVYVFAISLMMSLFVETKFYAVVAFQIVRMTRLNFWLTILVINLLAWLLCMWMNNIFIAALLMPLTIKLMELVGAHSWPAILNMVFMCNVTGRAFIGTLITKVVLNEIEAINAGVTLRKLLDILFLNAMLVGLLLMGWFAIIYTTFAPQYAGKIKEVRENVELLHLWYRASLAIPDVSLRHHIIKRKITTIRQHLYQEMDWIKTKKDPYKTLGAEKTVAERLAELAPKYKVHNGFLLFKCFIILISFVVLMVPYIYNQPFKFWTYEDIRLGYIALFISLLCLLFVHSRDFEVMLKRIDIQTIVIVLCLSFIASVFVTLTKHMDDFLWKTYGTTMTGKRVPKVSYIVKILIPLTAVSGLFNEHVVCLGFLDTVLMFSVFRGFNALGEILGGFLLMTAFWGNATMMGTIAGLVVAGMADQQGHRITFCKWLGYGLPVAVLTVFAAFINIHLRYLTGG